MEKTGFDSYISVPAEGRSGGLLVLWKSYHFIDETLNLKKTTKRFVAFDYKNNTTTYPICFIFAYAPAQQRDKGTFWQEITEFIKNCNQQCIVMGDLNEIQNQADKLGEPYQT